MQIISRKELKEIKPSLVHLKRKCSEFKRKLKELEVEEALQVNISEWKSTHKAPPSNLWSLKPKKFERMQDKTGIYWYIIRTK